MNTISYEQESLLHERLLHGDITASAEIAEQFLFIVIQRLHRRYQHLEDSHLVDTAVHEAFMHYFQHPERYNPDKMSLSSYLLMSAEGDLRNILNSSHETSQATIDSADIDDLDYNITIVDDYDLERDMLDRLSMVWPQLDDYLPDPTDREIAYLMLDNVRQTRVYADVLGIQSKPIHDQQLIVKRYKDRLRKRLRRLFDPIEFRNHGER